MGVSLTWLVRVGLSKLLWAARAFEGGLRAWGRAAPARPPTHLVSRKCSLLEMPVKGRYTSLTSHTPPGAWVDRGQAECMHVLCTNNRWAVLSLSSLVGPPSKSPSSWPAPCLVSSPPFWVLCPPPSSPAPAPRGGRVATAPEGPVADFQPLGRETPRVGPPGPLADASLLASPGLCRLGCESVGCLSGRCSQFPF